MEKIKELNRYQKGILILLVAMAIIFGVLYARATSKTGFLYMDKIFEVSQENGNTVYSGNEFIAAYEMRCNIRICLTIFKYTSSKKLDSISKLRCIHAHSFPECLLLFFTLSNRKQMQDIHWHLHHGLAPFQAKNALCPSGQRAQ